ncbi:hypothetical protein P23_1138 [Acinetobacter calcoaceticus]|nr:hypothetical protein P23_1138 [Acinetobacter calcoaceticus]
MSKPIHFSGNEKQSGIDFDSKQIIALKQIKKKLPKVIKFFLAEKFDDKFLVTTDNVWSFYYSGQREKINFKKFTADEICLIKFFFISFIQKNTPSSLNNKLYSFKVLSNYLHINSLNFTYENLKKFLTSIAPIEEQAGVYAHIKFLLRLLISEDFPEFDISNDYDLEFIPRPKSFNSKLFYQQYEDPIDYPIISMIQSGFAKINDEIKKNEKNIKDKTLLYSSILGLIYTTGLRPVQLAKLSTSDIRIDTTREHDQFHRYSILVPYAKQIRYSYDKIAVKLPEEVAEIILMYAKRFNLQPKDKLFDLGENSARFCSIALNTQLFEFSPKSYQNAVLSGELLQEKYSFSDFRHHVGYSLAMAGASAEEISYILGHSVLVTARHYIYSTPALAQIRANALGKNSLYKQMIAMLLTGRIIYKNTWQDKKVIGNIGGKIHYDIGGCSYEEKCLFQPVRNCYGCMYFHPFIDADHVDVLKSIQNEINDLIRLSDGIGISRNPLIRVHESTKFEIESVIARCEIFKDGEIHEN